MIGVRCALLATLLLSGVLAQDPVRVAASSDGRLEVWLGSARGLVVEGWGAAPGGRLSLGSDAAWPRFDEGGDLWFERSVDDGHRILATSHWRVRRGSVDPQPVPAAAMPPYRLPPPGTARASAAVKVCIDPGHGGSDPGAIGIGGLQEKVVTLDVALKLRAWLARDTQDPSGGGSWSVLLTRTSDVFVGLSQRANMANAFGAESFLSIHMNAFGSSSANGTETYCFVGEEQNAGGRLRNVVQSEALLAWSLRNRGTKSANFAVLRQTAMPAALLEGGFMTSPIDILKIRSAAERDRLGLHCLYALQQHHGFARHRPGAATGTLKGVLYDTTFGLQARVGGALVSLADGTFTVTRASDGYFEITAPAGAVAYAGTAQGFHPAQASATVPAGGEVWGSFGLTPASVPGLVLPPSVPPGGSLPISVQGDPGSPAVLVAAPGPGLPLLDLTSLGLGFAWPDLGTAATLPLGSVGPAGSLSLVFTAPTTIGARAHCQAVVRSGGRWRLTNGAAFEVR